MKNASLNIIYCISFMIIIPIVMYLYIGNIKTKTTIEETHYISVYNTKNKKISMMSLEEYVWRATAKEMPSTFEDEAIKAQAVAIRTYAIRKIGASIPEHNGADVCTDFGHCTAFLSEDEENKQNKLALSKYKVLTEETKNQIITFENEPILAVFHSISSGTTEKSSDVWSSQLPYLTNTNSELDKNVKGYHSCASFRQTELEEHFPKTTDNNIKIISRTDGGSVKNIEIFGNLYTGQEVRNALKLRSANFTVKKDANTYIFDVVGYGHGVGMSQHGANEYAKKGMSYIDILKKYYPTTTITKIN